MVGSLRRTGRRRLPQTVLTAVSFMGAFCEMIAFYTILLYTPTELG